MKAMLRPEVTVDRRKHTRKAAWVLVGRDGRALPRLCARDSEGSYQRQIDELSYDNLTHRTACTLATFHV